jgi:cyclic-di-AMP phosphodiesterase
MPEFITKRWVRAAQTIAVCFCFLLLSVFHWGFGLLGIVFLFIFFLTLYHAERSFQKELYQYILNLTRHVRRSKRFSAEHLPVGILLYDVDKKITWHNRFVHELHDQKRLIGSSLHDAFVGLQEERQFHWEWQGKTYQVDHFPAESAYYFHDISQQVELEKRNKLEQTVLGLIHLDNFDEIGQGLAEQDETMMVNKVYSKVAAWALKYDLALKRYDEDKMFFVTRKRELDKLIQSRFEILDEIRKIIGKNSVPFTLSIGIASEGETVVERSQNALAALHIALARGGDQAAIQDGERIVFFGGKTNAIEKRTRVRARVVSQAIGNLMRDHQRVLIMGHRDPDMDALGAAIGMSKFAKVHDCQVKIVLNEGNPSIDKLMAMVQGADKLKDLFMSSDKAAQWSSDPRTLLVLVDTHKSTLAIDPKLVKRAKKIIVIDHHRRGEEFVKDPVLVYIEPYASSTCELVTELLQYQDRTFKLDPLEASALLAGIVVDTKKFAYHTGARTFEAASFLRRRGADLYLVQSLLKEDLSRYLKRAEMLKETELLYAGKIAIATGDKAERYDQLLIAQTADTLLEMQDVIASFVIAQRDDQLISISARSQGGLNVQLIMEQMGGGGHFTNAAIQIAGVSVSEVKQQLLNILDKNQKELS